MNELLKLNPKIRLIGISGKAGAGKDTLCLFLTQEFEKKKEVATRVSFADALKDLIGDSIFNLDEDQLYGSDKEYVDQRYGKSPRVILQEAGVAIRNIYPDIWILRALQVLNQRCIFFYEDCIYAIVTDVRFPNELEWIKDNDGFAIRLLRPGIKGVNDHESETALDDDPRFDLFLKNEGDLNDLRIFVSGLTRRIEAHFNGR